MEKSAGIQKLIDRIHNEGVQAAQQEAKRILKDATEQSSQIIKEATKKAEKLQQKALKEIETEQLAAKQAVQMAFRDTILNLKTELSNHFALQIKRMISSKLKEEKFLEHLILAVAGKIKEQPQEILLAENLFKETKDNSNQEQEKEKLKSFISQVLKHSLCEGIELKTSTQDFVGIRLKLEENLEMDLTDEALSQLLLKHLLPKFRSFVAGIEI